MSDSRASRIESMREGREKKAVYSAGAGDHTRPDIREPGFEGSELDSALPFPSRFGSTS